MLKTTKAALLAAALACIVTQAANAVDVRSWDQKLTAKERFVVLNAFDKQAVLDRETQLVWQRQSDGRYNYDHGLHHCRLTDTGGRNGWRLPTIEELSSLVGEESILPSGHPFILEEPIPFWTASMDPREPGTMLARRLDVRATYPYLKSTNNYVLCVRGPDTR